MEQSYAYELGTLPLITDSISSGKYQNGMNRRRLKLNRLVIYQIEFKLNRKKRKLLAINYNKIAFFVYKLWSVALNLLIFFVC